MIRALTRTVATTLLGVAALAAPAGASTVWQDGSVLTYAAGPQEANALDINLQGADATVQDAGRPTMTLADPCRSWADPMLDGTGALCPAFPVERVLVDLGDGPDSLSSGAMTPAPLPTAALGGPGNDRIWTSSGADDLTGGPGQDVLQSNGGNDLIDAADGEPDIVDCGDGQDVAIVDPVDQVSPNCETLLSRRPADRPMPVVPPAPAGSAHPTPVIPAPVPAAAAPAPVHLQLTVPDLALRRARAAGLPVRATCGRGCHVTAVVRLSAVRASALGLPRVLGRASRAGAADGVARLRVALHGRALATVRRLRVTIHAEGVTAAGQHVTQDVELTLRA